MTKNLWNFDDNAQNAANYCKYFSNKMLIITSNSTKIVLEGVF